MTQHSVPPPWLTFWHPSGWRANLWSHHLDDYFAVGVALLEVGEGVRDLIEREEAVGDDFELLFVGQLGQERQVIARGMLNM
jgi:hypothetical protein